MYFHVAIAVTVSCHDMHRPFLHRRTHTTRRILQVWMCYLCGKIAAKSRPCSLFSAPTVFLCLLFLCNVSIKQIFFRHTQHLQTSYYIHIHVSKWWQSAVADWTGKPFFSIVYLQGGHWFVFISAWTENCRGSPKIGSLFSCLHLLLSGFCLLNLEINANFKI